MRQYFAFLSILLLLTMQTTLAQDETFKLTLKILKTDTVPQKRLMSSGEWQSFQSKSTTLQTLEGIARIQKPALVFLGLKDPLAYFSNEAGSKQVQYIDVGLKLDYTVGKHKGLYAIEIRPEYSVLDPTTGVPDRSSCFITETSFPIARGQTAIISRVSGKFCQPAFKALFPETDFGPKDGLFFTVTLE
ncbi:MAG TPA: hypothetical protein EYO33_12120 [Phycisphaerales bacterium]|nr:hypothetical protein [Phycisphaerales bacterium]